MHVGLQLILLETDVSTSDIIFKMRFLSGYRAFARACLVVVYKVIVTALAALGDQSCTTKRLDGRTRSQLAVDSQKGGDTESSTILSDFTDKSLTGPNGLCQH